MEPNQKLTLLFTATGVITGIISGFITIADIRLNIVAPFIALILFYVSYKLATYEKFKSRILKVAEGFPGKKKVATTGFWPHFIMWLILWIMVYTLLLVK